MEPKPCIECHVIMYPSRTSTPHTWEDKMYCGYVCRGRANSRAKQKKRTAHDKKVVRSTQLRALAQQKIAELIRIPWTRAWYE